MKLLDALSTINESSRSFYHAFHAHGFEKNPSYTEIYRNPSRTEFSRLLNSSQEKHLRATILTDGSLLVWDANLATHGDVDDELRNKGGPENIHVWLLLYPDHVEMNDIHLHRDGEEDDEYLNSKVDIVSSNRVIRSLYGKKLSIIGLDNDADTREVLFPRSLNESPYGWDNSAFKRYMQNPEPDYYQFWWQFPKFMDSLLDDEEVSESDHQRVMEIYDEEDAETFEKMPKAIQSAFMKWIEGPGMDQLMRDDPAEAPTWVHASYNRFIHPQTWLVHFSNDADSIAHEGFQYGMDQMDKLGLTTQFQNDGYAKKFGGYNFAFVANGKHAKWAASQKKYGRDFVMFQHGGVSMHHHGDEEDQVVFYGKGVNPKSIVLVTDDGGDFVVRASGNHRDPFRGSFEAVVKWVMQNYQQYRRVLQQ